MFTLIKIIIKTQNQLEKQMNPDTNSNFGHSHFTNVQFQPKKSKKSEKINEKLVKNVILKIEYRQKKNDLENRILAKKLSKSHKKRLFYLV